MILVRGDFSINLLVNYGWRVRIGMDSLFLVLEEISELGRLEHTLTISPAPGLPIGNW